MKDQQVVAIATMQISVNTTWNVADKKVLSTLEVHIECSCDQCMWLVMLHFLLL